MLIQPNIDEMLAAVLSLRSLRARFDGNGCCDDDAGAAMRQIVEIDDHIPSCIATTVEGALAALEEAEREWRIFHARAGEPGHDNLSTLLREALKLADFLRPAGQA